jgi:hypothetical protein
MTRPQVTTRSRWSVWSRGTYCSVLQGCFDTEESALRRAGKVDPQDGTIEIEQTITTTIRWNPVTT